MSNMPKQILVVSNEPWGDVWFSKQHYAYELSKLGHQVYFINPTSKWNWFNIFSFKVIYTTTNYKNITIVNYKNNFPQTIFKRFFTRLNDFLNGIKLNRYIKLNNSNLIWWKFEPYRFLSSFPFNKNKHVYHVVDSYNFLWQDKYQARGADLIICTNPMYIDYYATNYINNTIIQIPHGVSEDEFEQDIEEVNLIKEKFGDFVILIGSLSHDIDLELLKRVAEIDVKIVVIGIEIVKIEEWDRLKTLKNVTYLGEMHAKKIKNYIAASKVGLVAYKFKKIVDKNSRTPLKIMNYLAQNKPVITSLKTPLSSLETKAIYSAETIEEYVLFVKKAIQNQLFVDEKEVKEYLDNHKYSNLINQILNHLY